jgi:hypothetical protein
MIVAARAAAQLRNFAIYRSWLTRVDVCHGNHEARSYKLQVLADNFNGATQDTPATLLSIDILFFVKDGRRSDGRTSNVMVHTPRCIAPPAQAVESFRLQLTILFSRLPTIYRYVVIHVVTIYSVIIPGPCVRQVS